jgi:quercetin dioxygenase-like cupin family protein
MAGGGALAAEILAAQGQSTGPKVVFQHALPDLELKGWSVTAVEVSYGPGDGTPSHSHLGITIAYVLEGTIRSKVGDGPEQTYSVGQMFLETPGQVHGVSRNASATQPAKLLAILLAENGKPLTTPTKG